MRSKDGTWLSTAHARILRCLSVLVAVIDCSEFILEYLLIEVVLNYSCSHITSLLGSSGALTFTIVIIIRLILGCGR